MLSPDVNQKNQLLFVTPLLEQSCVMPILIPGTEHQIATPDGTSYEGQNSSRPWPY